MLYGLLVFWKSNSACVSTPWSSRPLSCVSFAMGSSSAAGAEAGAACGGACWYCCWVLQIGDLRVLVCLLLEALITLLAGVVRDAAHYSGPEQWPSLMLI